MAYAIIHNRVSSYAEWKRHWDATEQIRRNGGVKNEQVFRNPGTPDDVVLLVEFDSLDQARQFAQSEEFNEMIRGSGIQDRMVYFPTEV